MEKVKLEAQLNAINYDVDWQSAVRTLVGIIERLNAEIEEMAEAEDGEA